MEAPLLKMDNPRTRRNFWFVAAGRGNIWFVTAGPKEGRGHGA